MANGVVKWNGILLPVLGIGIGIGGAASGLSKGLVVWLILGACALILGGEYLWLQARGDAES